jgi:putative flippase GtrA
MTADRAAIKRIIRFGVVGLLNTAFGYGLYVLLVYLGTLPELALLGATIIGVIFNFFTTGRLVFRNSDNGLFARFAAAYASIYVLNALALRGAISVGLGPFAAQALLLPFSVVGTFAIMRAFVFPEVSK